MTDCVILLYRTFSKRRSSHAERIRENAERNKGGSAQEGDVTGEGRQRGEEDSRCYVEQETSR